MDARNPASLNTSSMRAATSRRLPARPLSGRLSRLGVSVRIPRWLVLLLPTCVVLFVFFAALSSLVYYSAKPSLGMLLIGEGHTIENYVRFVGDPFYLGYLWLSFKLATIATAIVLVLGYIVAYYMSQCSPRMQILIGLLLIIQFFTAYVIRAYAVMLILGRQGIVNTTLISIGIIDRPLAILFTEAAVIIGLVLIAMPFMVLPIYSSLTAIPENLGTAARSLGASAPKVFWHVTLPLSLPGLAAGVTIVFLFTFTSYVIPGLLGGGYVDMVANFIYRQAMQTHNYPFASASAVVVLISATLSIYLLQKMFQRMIRGV